MKSWRRSWTMRGRPWDEAAAAADVDDDPDKSRRHGPLHLGAAAGKLELCKLLVEEFKANVDATDVQGATPLIFAIQGVGCAAVVGLVLSHGADANKADNGGIAPLHIAAERGSYEVAELLLSRGANVDPICENHGAPVHVAARNGHAEVLKLLLQNEADAGADVNAGSQVTPLTVAADKGLSDCTKCLLETHADANIPDESGKMPIEIAMQKGWDKCVKLLFPVTNPLLEYADWSIDGVIQNGKIALDMDPNDSTLYAKRSVCFQNMGEKESALADANAYRDMQPDLPKSRSEEGAALKLAEEYCQGIEVLMSGLNLGPQSDPADKASRGRPAVPGGRGRGKAAAAPPLRRSSRARKPNVRVSGPEWTT
ncbi:hypothetical protein BS78_09G063700 [Paspalum vaginatum]|nr:hypothetical protein BS78_09G063700 [Paspalum vaginatum]